MDDLEYDTTDPKSTGYVDRLTDLAEEGRS